MALLDTVTITGADDSVSPADLVQAVAKYPLAEIGILVGGNPGTPRFPTPTWLSSLLDAIKGTPVRTSAHLCYDWARTFLTEVVEAVPYNSLWNRIQVNTGGVLHDVRLHNLRMNLNTFCSRGVQVVFQGDGVNDEVFDWAHDCWDSCADDGRVGILYDRSQGNRRREWRVPLKQSYCGYAGGLSSENVSTELCSLNETINVAISCGSQPAVGRRYWVEFEVRSEDGQRFDLGRAEAVLKAATDYNLGKAP